MDVRFLYLYVVLSCADRGLSDGLITRPEESYCVSNSVWSQKPRKGPYIPVGKDRKMNISKNYLAPQYKLIYLFINYIRMCRNIDIFISVHFSALFLRALFLPSPPWNTMRTPRVHAFHFEDPWLTLLLHIHEVLGLDLGPETGYPDLSIFVAFIRPSNQFLSYYLRPFPSTFFPVHHSLFTPSFDVV
jgi:hypothetical protein